jgi:hypothetical protein
LFAVAGLDGFGDAGFGGLGGAQVDVDLGGVGDGVVDVLLQEAEEEVDLVVLLRPCGRR